MGAALFVFAHQDDEIAAASRIEHEIVRGSEVHCVFLTDGGAPQRRNSESTAVLARLGVASDRIEFVSSIADGALVDHLQFALERLERKAADVVYCLAWEGGHHDHDASALVAAAFAKRRGVACYEMPLYNGCGTRGPFFRVMAPIGGGWQRRRISGARYAMLAWSYPSQWKSWLALFPEAFVKLAILRREWIRAVDPARFRTRPHEGALYYERRFRFSYERFSTAAAAFVDAYF